MNHYLVSYDLAKPTRNYVALYSRMSSFLQAFRITESLWAIETFLSTADVRDQLMAVLDSDDSILVSRFSDWASYNQLQVNERLQRLTGPPIPYPTKPPTLKFSDPPTFRPFDFPFLRQ